MEETSDCCMQTYGKSAVELVRRRLAELAQPEHPLRGEGKVPAGMREPSR